MRVIQFLYGSVQSARTQLIVLSPNFSARLRFVSSVAATLVIAALTPALFSWRLPFLHG